MTHEIDEKSDGGENKDLVGIYIMYWYAQRMDSTITTNACMKYEVEVSSGQTCDLSKRISIF